MHGVGKGRFAVVRMLNRFIIALFICMVSILTAVNLHMYINYTPDTLCDEHRDRLFFQNCVHTVIKSPE